MEKLQLGLFDRSDILRGSFSPTSHCNLKCFGYTLIELVMTIVIMSILMIVSVPIFFSTTTYQRQVYYDELLNGIRYARILAIGTGNHIQVSLTGNSITLQQRIEGSGCTAGTTFQPILDPGTRATGFVKNAPGTVTINFSANWPLYFNGLGQALSSSNCAVIGTATVGVVGGNTMTVFGQTGFVQ
jgi:prepilin-type N-terminal cleavage/methylation domain-containing protein